MGAAFVLAMVLLLMCMSIGVWAFSGTRTPTLAVIRMLVLGVAGITAVTIVFSIFVAHVPAADEPKGQHCVDGRQRAASYESIIPKRQRRKRPTASRHGGEAAFVVVGIESSGSRLTAKSLAAALGIMDGWDGLEDIGNRKHHVFHRSLPHGNRDVGVRGSFPEIPTLVASLERSFEDVFVVLTVRDAHIEQCSKLNMHNGGDSTTNVWEMQHGRELVRSLMAAGYVDVVVSYEALMFIGEPYMYSIYDKLGIKSSYMPRLVDANHRYIRPCVPSSSGAGGRSDSGSGRDEVAEAEAWSRLVRNRGGREAKGEAVSASTVACGVSTRTLASATGRQGESVMSVSMAKLAESANTQLLLCSYE
ncbi:uncharacterized protein AMSG_07451 [Thecamonas trahens ATCC 50062]|uniref:Uncharacterized protein n=1 Tax=Thecamonas trahens ATCC 50062 TaxID=461836 RepID=A0A0L0DHE3_THETB|nr:hypothetical protein AMSG_07451 [Thecamonas trahens ATCC 50062]KNC51551.1 hypothetical protein AMSG_07451 [Thecamonas trahens ATCC 50062]|eukprot:XP_013755953.1 hypothetical protein AMSG_07451 [Thecamonas trahens ATCC 50062]